MSSAAPLPLIDPRSPDSVWRRYSDFLRRPPLLTLEWADAETPARGWLVINSLRGGAAGGGTRMRAGLGRREVTYLAKTMELKFTFSGPPIGGAKSGIDFDPTDPRKPEVLRRWFRAVAAQLHHHYGTGGDLNVDEVLDVIPAAARRSGSRTRRKGSCAGTSIPPPMRCRGSSARSSTVSPPRWRMSTESPVSPLSVADLITGYGVARSLVHLFEQGGRSIRGTRVLIEGFGAVGGPCALYLAREGALVVGIADRESVLLEPRGLAPEEVEALLHAREDKLLPRNDPRVLRGPERARFWQTPAEIFVAAACSESIDRVTLGKLARQGVRTLACGANQPFRENELGATEVQRFADANFTVVPDVVANCGMARAHSFLMDPSADPLTPGVFTAVDRTIGEAVGEIVARGAGQRVGLLGAGLAYALDHLNMRST